MMSTKVLRAQNFQSSGHLLKYYSILVFPASLMSGHTVSDGSNRCLYVGCVQKVKFREQTSRMKTVDGI